MILHLFFFCKSYLSFFKIYLFIYFWLCWVFVSVRGLSLVAASRGHSSSRCTGLSLSRPLLLRSTGSRRAGSVVVAHGPSCSVACGIFPDQGSNPYPLHWQADSQPLRHQGSPCIFFKNLVLYFESFAWLHRLVSFFVCSTAFLLLRVIIVGQPQYPTPLAIKIGLRMGLWPVWAGATVLGDWHEFSKRESFVNCQGPYSPPENKADKEREREGEREWGRKRDWFQKILFEHLDIDMLKPAQNWNFIVVLWAKIFYLLKIVEWGFCHLQPKSSDRMHVIA